MAQWQDGLTNLKGDHSYSMTEKLVDDFEKWIKGDIDIFAATSKEYWITWKKNLLKAGNIEAGHTGIDWSKINVDNETLWNTWRQNCKNSRHDPKQMIQLFHDMVENYNMALNEAKTNLQRFKIFAGLLESAPQVVLQTGFH